MKLKQAMKIADSQIAVVDESLNLDEQIDAVRSEVDHQIDEVAGADFACENYLVMEQLDEYIVARMKAK